MSSAPRGGPWPGSAPMPEGGCRIAMWSTPRSLSTVLMRSWENRPDTEVVDEPLYAYYLDATGADHPGREAVLASQPRAWTSVVAYLTGPVPGGSAIWYQKHMAHHMLPEVPLDWLGRLHNVFLLRDPRAVLRSYARVRRPVTVEDLGYPQLYRLREHVLASGSDALVVEAADLQADARRCLSALCEALGVPFSEAMLSWPAGPRPSDGVWAPYWYGSVQHSTGFSTPCKDPEPLPGHLAGLAEACMDYYTTMRPERVPS